MKKQSAGIMLYRSRNGRVEVLIGHPGGPYWVNKNKSSWSIPKGEFQEGERPIDAARREFSEEIGLPVPDGELIELTTLRQPSGKRVTIWILESDLDVSNRKSNEFEMEWPPRTGQMKSFPEIDRVAWSTLEQARKRLVKGQVGFIDAFVAKLGIDETPQTSLF